MQNGSELAMMFKQHDAALGHTVVGRASTINTLVDTDAAQDDNLLCRRDF